MVITIHWQRPRISFALTPNFATVSDFRESFLRPRPVLLCARSGAPRRGRPGPDPGDISSAAALQTHDAAEWASGLHGRRSQEPDRCRAGLVSRWLERRPKRPQ